MIPNVVGGLHVQLGIIWMVSEELALSLQSRHVLTVDLESQGPESTLPNQTSLGVLYSNVVFVVDTLGRGCEVEASCVVPVRNDTNGGEG